MTTIPGKAGDRAREGRFFIAMAVLMLIVVTAGFLPTTFLPFVREPGVPSPFESVLFVHGAVSAAWMCLFIIQPFLIQAGRVRQHRALGMIGVGIAALVVVLGFWAALAAAARPDGAALRAMGLRGIGLFGGNLLMFGVLVGLAVAYRRNGGAHKRLMYLATVNMLQAPMVRITGMLNFPLIAGAMKAHLLAYAFILPLVAWDAAVHRRIHPATLWGGLAILMFLPTRYQLTDTAVYRGIAQSLVEFVR